MAKHDLTKLARDFIVSFNKSDWPALTARLTSNATYNEIGTQRHIRNPDAIIETMKGWKTAMPDANGTVNNALLTGDTVVLEITWQGTQTGPFQGPGLSHPPSGKRQTTRAAMFLTFKGDKIEECRHYFDMLSFLQQIGAAPTMAATTR